MMCTGCRHDLPNNLSCTPSITFHQLSTNLVTQQHLHIQLIHTAYTQIYIYTTKRDSPLHQRMLILLMIYKCIFGKSGYINVGKDIAHVFVVLLRTCGVALLGGVGVQGVVKLKQVHLMKSYWWCP